MEKLDLTRHYKAWYTARAQPELIDAEEAHFISISGKGDPSSSGFADDIQALYATAYALKFAAKAEGKDYTVAKLEGLWSFDEERYGHLSMTEAPVKIPRSEWNYRMLIRLPEFVNSDRVSRTAQEVVARKQLPRAADVHYFTLPATKAVQMLHKGPFATEPESLQLIQAFIQSRGFQRNGLHHEIYLSDFNRTAPEKLRTILREPVR